jgi:hypothetical protein
MNHSAIVDINDCQFDSSHYTKETRDLFCRVSSSISSDVKGFSNNFFECTITILARYIQCLSLEFISHDDEIDIVFANKIYFLSNPNYYLAEHESQGRVMYNRAYAFQKTLINFVKKESKVNIIYLGKRISNQLLLNLIRDSAVFVSRFIKRCKLFASKKPLKCQTEKLADIVIIIRNLSQFYVLKPMIEKYPHAISIVCGDTYMGGEVFDHVLPWSKEFSRVSIHTLRPLKLKTILWENVKVLIKYFRLNQQIFTANNIEIYVTQAIREILIMSADVELYRKQLDATLLNTSDRYLLTCEQKSPHAYIEASVAKSYNYRCIHIMSCDQDSNDLPFPVFGDRFVVDTLKRKELFTEGWSSNTEKLVYIGSLKSMFTPVLQDGDFQFDYCYFADAVEVNHNINVIRILELQVKKDSGFSYCIKLHPRDSGSWINTKIVQNGVVYQHGQVSNDELYDKFNMAISNPSGVVMDLLCRLKPFIFIDVISSYKNIEFVYCDQQYSGYITELEVLSEMIQTKSLSNNDVAQLYIRIFGKSGMSPTIERLTQFI